MAIKAITPDEAALAKFEKHVPEEVILAANELIASKLSGSGHASFTLDELIKAIQRKLPKTTATKMEKGHWLDIEPFYRAAGWKVDYDQPGYNEDYPATFKFSKAK